jgi:hypothetical protein
MTSAWMLHVTLVMTYTAIMVTIVAVRKHAITAAAPASWEGYGEECELDLICRVCEFLGVVPLHTEVNAGLA